MSTLPVLPDYSECSGECCTAFELGPESPESLLDCDPRRTGAAHGYEISHMLVYLGLRSKPPRGCGVFQEHRALPHRHWYTCVHYDRERRRCTNYDLRPHLCRAYPYGADCGYKGCTQRGGAGTHETSPLLASDTCPACRGLGAASKVANAGTPLRRCYLCRSTGVVTDTRRRRVWAALMRRLEAARRDRAAAQRAAVEADDLSECAAS